MTIAVDLGRKATKQTNKKRQVISHEPSVMSIILMVKNGMTREIYIYHLTKQLLTYVSVDMECY